VDRANTLFNLRENLIKAFISIGQKHKHLLEANEMEILGKIVFKAKINVV